MPGGGGEVHGKQGHSQKRIEQVAFQKADPTWSEVDESIVGAEWVVGSTAVLAVVRLRHLTENKASFLEVVVGGGGAVGAAEDVVATTVQNYST